MGLAPRIEKLEGLTNLYINGNFDFWQRGTSFPSAANGSFTTDRLNFANSMATGWDITRSTDVPTRAQSGFTSSYSFRVAVSSGATSPTAAQIVRLNPRIEGLDYANLHGKPFRVQFWCKSSVAGQYAFSLQNNNRDRIYTTTYTINSVNTWEKKVIDVVGDTTGTWLFDNNVGLQVEWVLASGSNQANPTPNTWVAGAFGTHTSVAGQANLAATNANAFHLAQVSLIPGSFDSTVDIPFQRAGKTIGDELRLCKRYCHVIGNDGAGSLPTQRVFGMGTNYSATTVLLPIIVPVPLRAVPTLTPSAGSWFTTYTGPSSQSSSSAPAVATEMGPGEFQFYTTVTGFSGLTVGQASWNLTNANARLIIDAEL